MRLSNDNPQVTVAAEGRFRLDPGTHGLRIRVRMRARGLMPGPNPLDTAQLRYGFENALHEHVGLRSAPLLLKQDGDWTTLEGRANVPDQAFALYLSPALVNCTGTLNVDDIQVEQVK